MLAIGGGKGGCGKTTVTLGLAAAAGRRRRSVLAVDADRQMPNLHLAAGVPREPTLSTVAEGAAAPTAAQPVPGCPGVRVLGAPTEPDTTIGDVAPALDGAADRVLVDCPAGAGPDAVDPLEAATGVVLVTTADDRSVADAAKTASMARSLDTPVLAVAVSRAERVPDRVTERFEAPGVPIPTVGGGTAENGVPIHRRRRLRGWFDRVLGYVNGQQT